MHGVFNVVNLILKLDIVSKAKKYSLLENWLIGKRRLLSLNKINSTC